MRLIDADAVKQNILEVIKKQGGKSKDLIPVRELPLFIDIQQTAYSVDKVVEELEEMKTIKDSMKTVTCRKWDYGTVNRAIEIVKQGGVSDDVCEWKYDTTYSYYKVGCKETIVPIQYGDYCPYCGKKIKAVK